MDTKLDPPEPNLLSKNSCEGQEITCHQHLAPKEIKGLTCIIKDTWQGYQWCNLGKGLEWFPSSSTYKTMFGKTHGYHNKPIIIII